MRTTKWLYVLLLILIVGCSNGGTQVSTGGWQEQYDLGLRYLSEGGYEEAVVAFTAAIAIDPKQATVYVGRGDAYVGLEQYETAVSDYEQSITLDESVAEVYLKLADSYIALGDTDKAREALERGLAATGDNELIQERLAGMQRPHITLTEAELQLLLPLEEAIVALNEDLLYDLWASPEVMNVFANLLEAEKSYTYKYAGQDEWTISREDVAQTVDTMIDSVYYLNYWQGGRSNGIHFNGYKVKSHGTIRDESDEYVSISTFAIVNGKAENDFLTKERSYYIEYYDGTVNEVNGKKTTEGTLLDGLYHGIWTVEEFLDNGWHSLVRPQYDHGKAINYKESEYGVGWDDELNPGAGGMFIYPDMISSAFVGFE